MPLICYLCSISYVHYYHGLLSLVVIDVMQACLKIPTCYVTIASVSVGYVDQIRAVDGLGSKLQCSKQPNSVARITNRCLVQHVCGPSPANCTFGGFCVDFRDLILKDNKLCP